MSTHSVTAWSIAAALAIVALPAQTQFAIRTPPSITTWSLRDLAIADFDGDGDLDLCGSTGLFTQGPRSILLRNDGQEQFTDVTATSLPPNTGNTLATVAFDMDGDGDLDLFISKQFGPSRLWRNDGNLVFTDVSANLPASATNHYQIVVADFDGDGDLDLAAALSFVYPGSLDRLFVNNGAGVFTEAPLPVPADTLGFVGIDFDGDGDIDLVAGSANGPHFLRNDGNLLFTDVTATWQPPGATGLVQSIAAGDIDGDGRPDLVCGNQLGSDLVLRNTGSTFVTIGALPTVGSGTKSLVLFDCDGDGDLDLARSTVQAGTQLLLDLNDGTGTFTPALTRLPTATVFSARVYAADLDGDGDAELVTAEEVIFFASQSNMVLWNRHRELTVPPAVLGQPWPLTVWSEPGYATLNHTCRLAVGLARLPSPLAVPGFGDLWLDLGGGYVAFEGIVFANAGSVTFPLQVPSLPPLVGLPLHVQALVEQARQPAHFTAYRSVVIQ